MDQASGRRSRVLLFTGKGGVGKTTTAAATAAAAAAAGHRTLVTSTDPAHSLADVLDAPLGDRPVTVADRLQGQQLDARTRLDRHWTGIRDYLVQVLAGGGVGDVQAEELALVPGLDELFALVDLRRQVDEGRYDVIVVDCAPTAETLRLLALPDALRWYVDRILGPGRRVARAVRPVAPRLGGVPVPDDRVFAAVEELSADLVRVRRLLQDTAHSSIRLVMTPERVVVAESLRTATSLGLFGYPVDAVVVNRLVPDAATDPLLTGWRRRQAAQLERVRDAFAPAPVLTCTWVADEPVGLDALAPIAVALYGDLDPTAVLHHGAVLEVVATEGGYLLRLPLAFATRDDVDLHRRGGQLHVAVGGHQRAVALPEVVRRCEVAGARLHEGALEVRFAARVGAR